MKSIQRRFNNVSEKNPNFSSYLCFAIAVAGQGFSRQRLCRWFYKLVDKDDYAWSERQEDLRHLNELTNRPEAYRK
ncbi:MAG: hypothetical protein UT82_C0012G0016 [Parcubacteria group bacterium GW2011_GWB1_40_14]|nr:MAG: hypothetical protein UT82_C0012G0016 [Parcubacteria group bacterium GW2011_GWB1_40_14]